MRFRPEMGENKGVAGALPGEQQSTGLLHLDGFESFLPANRKTTPNGVVFFLVDDIGLEPMTFRTSSGCSSQLS